MARIFIAKLQLNIKQSIINYFVFSILYKRKYFLKKKIILITKRSKLEILTDIMQETYIIVLVCVLLAFIFLLALGIITYLSKFLSFFKKNSKSSQFPIQLENENQLHIKPKPGESKKFDLQLEEPEMNHSLSIKNNNDLGKIESPLNNESSEFENSQENSKEINDIYCNQLKSETQLKQNEEYNSNN